MLFSALGAVIGIAGYLAIEVLWFQTEFTGWEGIRLLIGGFGFIVVFQYLTGRSYQKRLHGLIEKLQQQQELIDQLQHHQKHTETVMAEKTAELYNVNQQLRTEIAEHRHTADALHESEEHYRSLFENLQDVFYRTDCDGNVQLVSPSVVQLLGYSQEEAVNLNLRDNVFACPEQWPQFLSFIEENRYLEPFEIQLKRCDGSLIWGSAKVQWYTDKTGRILGFEGLIRDISERKNVEEALQQRTNQLETLRKVGLEVVAHLDLEGLLHSIVLSAIEISSGSEGGLYVYNSDQEVLEWAVTVEPHPVPLGTILHKGEDAAGRVWETGEPLILNDYQNWEGRTERYAAYGFTATVHVPVRWGEHFLGVLNVNGDSAHTFTQPDVELLSLFASQAAIAIRNARLYEAVRKRATQLTVVNEVARKVASILEPETLFQEIVTAIQQGFAYHNVILLRLNEETGELGRQNVAGAYASVAPPDYRQPLGVGLIGRTAQTGQSVMVNDVNREPGYIVGFPESVPTQSELCVPLKRGEQVLGVLDIQEQRPNAFDALDLTTLEILADQIVAAMENARLYKEMQQELLERKRIEWELQRTKDAALEAQQRAETAQRVSETAHQATEQALRTAEFANQAKSEFLANMSHELRTPLNSILGYAQIFQRDPSLSGEQREMVEIMARSGEHLLTMINHILDLSRIEAGKMELNTADFALGDVIETVAEIARVQAQQKSITLKYELPPALTISVHGDETRLRQVLLNLLGNAVKFTPHGEVTLRVSLRESVPHSPSDVWRQNALPLRRIRFEILDTGIGIPHDRLQEIFEPFRQVRDDRIQSKGLGLGLAISQRLVRMMGAELYVESGLNQGSVFWFELLLPEVTPLPASSNKSSPHIIGYHGPRRHVLLVDDAPDNRSVLRQILEPLGFEVTEAADGEEALRKAERCPPDMILMDLIMPIMDGFEATRRLRSQTGLQHHTRVIAVSANVFEQARQQSLTAGCDAVLTKPIHLDDLFDLFQQYLGLEWLYAPWDDQEASFVEAQGLTGEKRQFIPPPNGFLVELFECVKKGDLFRIPEYLACDELAQARYTPFIERVHYLARTFQIDELEHFLRHYLESEQNIDV